MSLYQTITDIAKIQAGQAGRDVTTSQIKMLYPLYSNTSIHNFINVAIKSNSLIRTKRGHYRLNDDNEKLRYIGLCVLLPMDVYEYKSICEKVR